MNAWVADLLKIMTALLLVLINGFFVAVEFALVKLREWQLNELIRYGKGFRVEDTPEYIEGSGYMACREVARRLHRGDFSIQAHLDLHGLNTIQAKESFDRFLKNSIATGKRAVLIVHGRGLSSPAKPVLKTKVVKWITRGPWRKWVIDESVDSSENIRTARPGLSDGGVPGLFQECGRGHRTVVHG